MNRNGFNEGHLKRCTRCGKEKPKTASLFSSMSPETITFEEAQRLLALPREVGRHPDDNEPIHAQNGRYGPYLTWGKETRSLETEDEIFTVDLDKALALLAHEHAALGVGGVVPGMDADALPPWHAPDHRQRTVEARRAGGVRVLGPAPAPIARLRDHHRFHLQFHGASGARLRSLVRAATADLKTPDAVAWIVDVDPVEML